MDNHREDQPRPGPDMDAPRQPPEIRLMISKGWTSISGSPTIPENPAMMQTGTRHCSSVLCAAATNGTEIAGPVPAIRARLEYASSDEAQDDLYMQARVRCLRHHRPQENRLEATVIVFGIVDNMPVRLAEGRHDLWHFDAEHAIRVRKRHTSVRVVCDLRSYRPRPECGDRQAAHRGPCGARFRQSSSRHCQSFPHSGRPDDNYWR